MFKKLMANPLVNVGVRYGAIGALLCMGFIVSLYYMGKHPLLINPFVDPRIPVFGFLLYFALRETRDYHQGGTLFFWQGMIEGFLFTVVCGSLCWLMLVALATMVPEFVTQFVALGLEQTKGFAPEDIQRIGEETFKQSLEELKQADGYFIASRYYVQSFVISFFVSIIVSVIVRRTGER